MTRYEFDIPSPLKPKQRSYEKYDVLSAMQHYYCRPCDTDIVQQPVRRLE